jgi:hypothetical protein
VLYTRYTDIAITTKTLLGVKDLLSRGVVVLLTKGIDDVVGFLI